MRENDIAVPSSLLSHTRVGAVVTIKADDGFEYRGRILRIERDVAIVRAFEKLHFPTESLLHLTLVQALPTREKMSFIIQKTVELGVNSIIPCRSAKSVDHTVPGKGQDKSHRWPAIAAKAVEQCRRRTVPAIAPIDYFSRVVQTLGNEDGLKVVLYERESTERLKDLAVKVDEPHRVIVICGPEGGFSEDEVLHAEDNGFRPVRLGGRILRCETAAITAVSIIQHVWGDL
jgi:16S rRNA (uracil1498-N3)-methyltransferase